MLLTDILLHTVPDLVVPRSHLAAADGVDDADGAARPIRPGRETPFDHGAAFSELCRRWQFLDRE